MKKTKHLCLLLAILCFCMANQMAVAKQCTPCTIGMALNENNEPVPITGEKCADGVCSVTDKGTLNVISLDFAKHDHVFLGNNTILNYNGSDLYLLIRGSLTLAGQSASIRVHGDGVASFYGGDIIMYNDGFGTGSITVGPERRLMVQVNKIDLKDESNIIYEGKLPITFEANEIDLNHSEIKLGKAAADNRSTFNIPYINMINQSNFQVSNAEINFNRIYVNGGSVLGANYLGYDGSDNDFGPGAIAGCNGSHAGLGLKDRQLHLWKQIDYSYFDFKNPTTMGSAGRDNSGQNRHGPGGGWIRLVGDTLELGNAGNNLISSNGGKDRSGSLYGSGGTIDLDVKYVLGNGTFQTASAGGGFLKIKYLHLSSGIALTDNIANERAAGMIYLENSLLGSKKLMIDGGQTTIGLGLTTLDFFDDRYQNFELDQLIVKRNANLFPINGEGKTPYDQRLKVKRVLLEEGGSISSEGTAGFGPGTVRDAFGEPLQGPNIIYTAAHASGGLSSDSSTCSLVYGDAKTANTSGSAGYYNGTIHYGGEAIVMYADTIQIDTLSFIKANSKKVTSFNASYGSGGSVWLAGKVLQGHPVSGKAGHIQASSYNKNAEVGGSGGYINVCDFDVKQIPEAQVTSRYLNPACTNYPVILYSLDSGLACLSDCDGPKTDIKFGWKVAGQEIVSMGLDKVVQSPEAEGKVCFFYQDNLAFTVEGNASCRIIGANGAGTTGIIEVTGERAYVEIEEDDVPAKFVFLKNNSFNNMEMLVSSGGLISIVDKTMQGLPTMTSFLSGEGAQVFNKIVNVKLSNIRPPADGCLGIGFDLIINPAKEETFDIILPDNSLDKGSCDLLHLKAEVSTCSYDINGTLCIEDPKDGEKPAPVLAKLPVKKLTVNVHIKGDINNGELNFNYMKFDGDIVYEPAAAPFNFTLNKKWGPMSIKGFNVGTEFLYDENKSPSLQYICLDAGANFDNALEMGTTGLALKSINVGGCYDFNIRTLRSVRGDITVVPAGADALQSFLKLCPGGILPFLGEKPVLSYTKIGEIGWYPNLYFDTQGQFKVLDKGFLNSQLRGDVHGLDPKFEYNIRNTAALKFLMLDASMQVDLGNHNSEEEFRLGMVGTSKISIAKKDLCGNSNFGICGFLPEEIVLAESIVKNSVDDQPVPQPWIFTAGARILNWDAAFRGGVAGRKDQLYLEAALEAGAWSASYSREVDFNIFNDTQSGAKQESYMGPIHRTNSVKALPNGKTGKGFVETSNSVKIEVKSATPALLVNVVAKAKMENVEFDVKLPNGKVITRKNVGSFPNAEFISYSRSQVDNFSLVNPTIGSYTIMFKDDVSRYQVNHTSLNYAPVMEITKAVMTSRNQLEVSWEAQDTDDVAKITFRLGNSPDGYGLIELHSTPFFSNTRNTVATFDVNDLPSGSYYLSAVIQDKLNGPVLVNYEEPLFINIQEGAIPTDLSFEQLDTTIEFEWKYYDVVERKMEFYIYHSTTPQFDFTTRNVGVVESTAGTKFSLPITGDHEINWNVNNYFAVAAYNFNTDEYTVFSNIVSVQSAGSNNRSSMLQADYKLFAEKSYELPSIAIVGETFQYQLANAGSGISYSLKTAQPCSAKISDSGLITFTPSAAEKGYIPVEIIAKRGERSESIFTLFKVYEADEIQPSLGVSKHLINKDDHVFITSVDPLANHDPTKRDKIAVEVDHGMFSNTIQLTETSANSGRFAGRYFTGSSVNANSEIVISRKQLNKTFRHRNMTSNKVKLHLQESAEPTSSIQELQEVAVTDQLIVSPNPSEGKFIISFDAQENMKGTCVIINMAGQQVYHAPVRVYEGKNMLDFNMEEMPSGTYHIRIITKSLFLKKKFQIIH